MFWYYEDQVDSGANLHEDVVNVNQDAHSFCLLRESCHVLCFCYLISSVKSERVLVDVHNSMVMNAGHKP
jgi:hypothetical protein